jgi:hypothetical protein
VSLLLDRRAEFRPSRESIAGALLAPLLVHLAELPAIRGPICDGAVHALVVCFASDDEENNMSQHWNLSYMEAGQQSNAASKLAEGDQAWAVKASEAGDDEDEPMEDAIQYQEDDQRAAQSTRNMPASTFESDDDEAASAPRSNIRVGGAAGAVAAAASSGGAAGGSGGDHNDNLAVGQLLNRTFVNRGTQIGVFKHGNSGLLEYVNNVPIVRDLEKQAFAPSEMMVRQQHATARALLHPSVCPRRMLTSCALCLFPVFFSFCLPLLV